MHSELNYFKGEPFEKIINPVNLLSPLEPDDNHKIFFKCPIDLRKPPVPYPDSYCDKWNDLYVQMPCSPENFYLCPKSNKKINRWDLIGRSLRKPITSALDLKTAILSYNFEFLSKWNFDVFEYLCDQDLIPDGGNVNFFKNTLPAMCALALNLPIYITKAIPLLKSDRECSLSLSQLQIASLLANGFFCTFPRKTKFGYTSKSASYPFINFTDLFSSKNTLNTKTFIGNQNALNIKVQKLRFILHYFYRVLKDYPTGILTFTRRCLTKDFIPDWSSSNLNFNKFKLQCNDTGRIEESGPHTLQVDFADKFLGGGVLSTGCVQEEIMFLIRPELIVSCLFSERMNLNEAFVVEGAEQYSVYKGYGKTISWSGNFSQIKDGRMKRDDWGRWNYGVIAVDATSFRIRTKQYEPDAISREINKFYTGVTNVLAPKHELPFLVASGNWGCGVFRGDSELKSLIQMMACVQSNKSLVYYTFGNKKFCNRLYEMYEFLSNHKITVGQLWNTIIMNSQNLKNNKNRACSVFDLVYRELSRLN